MLRDIPLKFLLLIGFFLSGVIPLLTMSIMSYEASFDELTDSSFKQLESVRKLKSQELKHFFKSKVAHLEVLSSNPFLVDAMSSLHHYMDRNRWDVDLQGNSHEEFSSPKQFKVIHDRYYPFFKKYIDNYQLYDLFFIDPKKGICYFTIKKESDFGRPVNTVHSSLTDVWKRVVETRQTSVSDTLLYAPSTNGPAQFIAAPVIVDGELLGVLAVQISIDTIDRIMGERSGMGRTGETYLVGSDYKMRSDSFLDPVNHSVDASLKGSIERNGVFTDASKLGLKGEEGNSIIVDYNGNRVLSSYGPLDIYGLRWAIIAEIDEEEINSTIREALNHKVMAIIFSAIGLLVILTFSISFFFNRGIRNVISQLEHIVENVLNGKVESRAEVAATPVDFEEVVIKINHLIDSFVEQMDEKSKLEQAIQYNQRLESIGTLAGGIAHDFNNILTYMYTYADLVHDGMEPSDTSVEYIDEILKAIDRATALVGQVMTFSKDVKREAHPILFSLVVKEALKLISASIPKSISVHKSISTIDLYVMANSTQLNQIVMNLCTNAYHALIGSGGELFVNLNRVTLEASNNIKLPEGDYALLEVRDTGVGIDPSIHHKIFDPFFTTKPEGVGTGMGLAVIDQIVTQLHGKVRFESEQNKGTTFFVYLPLSMPTASSESDFEQTIQIRSGLRVLLIDDEVQICKSTSRMLEDAGAKVEVFSSSDAALDFFMESRERFDVIITDYNMPYKNGVELCREIRGVDSAIAIIITTGYAEMVSEDILRELQILSLVQKPYSKTDLLDLMQKL